MEEEAAAATHLYIQPGAILNVQINEATLIHSIIHNPTLPSPDANMSSRQAVFAFVVAVLISSLQLRYQGKPESPFETQPVTMMVAVASLFVYCLSYDAKLRLSNLDRRIFNKSLWTRVVHVSMAIFGPLALAALWSVLFPKIPCWVLVSGAMFYSFCQLQLPGIRKAWNWFIVAIKNARFSHHQEHQQQRGGSRRRTAGRISVRIPRV